MQRRTAQREINAHLRVRVRIGSRYAVCPLSDVKKVCPRKHNDHQNRRKNRRNSLPRLIGEITHLDRQRIAQRANRPGFKSKQGRAQIGRVVVEIAGHVAAEDANVEPARGDDRVQTKERRERFDRQGATGFQCVEQRYD